MWLVCLTRLWCTCRTSAEITITLTNFASHRAHHRATNTQGSDGQSGTQRAARRKQTYSLRAVMIRGLWRSSSCASQAGSSDAHMRHSCSCISGVLAPPHLPLPQQQVGQSGLTGSCCKDCMSAHLLSSCQSRQRGTQRPPLLRRQSDAFR